jgi:hypothetical protein
LFSDYDPPSIFEDTPSYKDASDSFAPPTLKTEKLVAYENGGDNAPDLLPNIDFPNVLFIIELLIAFDAIFTSLNVITTLMRLRAKPPPALLVKKSVGLPDPLAFLAWRKKVADFLHTMSLYFQPKYISIAILVFLYIMMLLVYNGILYGPVYNDKGSYVYTSSGYTSNNNKIYEYYTVKKWNAEMVTVTNNCLQERQAQNAERASLFQSAQQNITDIKTWGQVQISNNGKSDIFNTSYQDGAYLKLALDPRNQSNCSCPLFQYNLTYHPQREAVAQQADSEVWVVLNNYILKAHLFFIIIIILRLAAARILYAAVVSISMFRTPHVTLEVSLPVTMRLDAGLNVKPSKDPSIDSLNFAHEFAQFRRKRLNVLAFSVLFFLFCWSIVLSCVSWNNRINTTQSGAQEFLNDVITCAAVFLAVGLLVWLLNAIYICRHPMVGYEDVDLSAIGPVAAATTAATQVGAALAPGDQKKLPPSPHAQSQASPAPKPPRPASRAPPKLPAGWEAVYTDNDEIYYHNPKTNKTSWEIPTE